MENPEDTKLPGSIILQCDECSCFVFYAVPGFDGLHECAKCGNMQQSEINNSNDKINNDDQT